ncbi:MAG: type II toxin-antitoxin system RelE/ParE family toxin [Pseudomonadota bacterium]
MQIVYTRKAKQDLQEIREYYGNHTPARLQNIISDIIGLVESIPNSLSKGRTTAHPDVWEKISPKYGYLLPYYVFQKKVYILSVYDPRRGGINYKKIVNLEE